MDLLEDASGKCHLRNTWRFPRRRRDDPMIKIVESKIRGELWHDVALLRQTKGFSSQRIFAIYYLFLAASVPERTVAFELLTFSAWKHRLTRRYASVRDCCENVGNVFEKKKKNS